MIHTTVEHYSLKGIPMTICTGKQKTNFTQEEILLGYIRHVIVKPEAQKDIESGIVNIFRVAHTQPLLSLYQTSKIAREFELNAMQNLHAREKQNHFRNELATTFRSLYFKAIEKRGVREVLGVVASIAEEAPEGSPLRSVAKAFVVENRKIL